jgi:hypothetical protein
MADCIEAHAEARHLVAVRPVRRAHDEEFGQQLLQRLLANVCSSSGGSSGTGGQSTHLLHAVVQVACTSARVT